MLVFFQRSPKIVVEHTQEYVGLGTSLDWLRMPPTNESSNSKLLIIIPGLTGHTQDNYVVSTAAALMPYYSQVCVYQYALVSDAQKSGRVDIMENLKSVINDVSTKYPVIHCVGFSYGANQLLYHVGS